jgi:hypothetical protein
MQLLSALGNLGERKGDSLLIPAAAYLDKKKYFDKTLEPKIKNLLNQVPYKVRMDALKRVGFIINENPDNTVIISEKYPKMLYAMSELAKAAGKVKTFGEHNFAFCDFRQIFSGYTPKYEDVMITLTVEQREVIDKVHALAKEMKLVSSCTTYWKINYHFKSVQVMCIDTDERFDYKTGQINSVRIRINGTNLGAPEYLDRIYEEGDAFVKYFMRHKNYCTGCSTSHIGWTKNVFGRNVRLCGHPSFRIVNPTEGDLDYIKKFIEFRKEMILLEKGK